MGRWWLLVHSSKWVFLRTPFWSPIDPKQTMTGDDLGDPYFENNPNYDCLVSLVDKRGYCMFWLIAWICFGFVEILSAMGAPFQGFDHPWREHSWWFMPLQIVPTWACRDPASNCEWQGAKLLMWVSSAYSNWTTYSTSEDYSRNSGEDSMDVEQSRC